MSKQWSPKKQTVQLAPSRIRRQPVPVHAPSLAKKAPRLSREQEIWLAITGIVLFAMAMAVVMLGFSVITGQGHDDSAAVARAQKFGDCEDGSNCIVDGETIRIGGSLVKIAGMEAPRIHSPRCSQEMQLGVSAVGKLHDLLNSGEVTTGAEVRQPDGEMRTIVLVDGKDVAAAMIGAGVARTPGSVQGGWC